MSNRDRVLIGLIFFLFNCWMYAIHSVAIQARDATLKVLATLESNK